MCSSYKRPCALHLVFLRCHQIKIFLTVTYYDFWDMASEGGLTRNKERCNSSPFFSSVLYGRSAVMTVTSHTALPVLDESSLFPLSLLILLIPAPPDERLFIRAVIRAMHLPINFDEKNNAKRDPQGQTLSGCFGCILKPSLLLLVAHNKRSPNSSLRLMVFW